MDSEGSRCLSQLRPSSVLLSALDSCSSETTSPLNQLLPAQDKPLTSDSISDILPQSNPDLNSGEHTKTKEDLHQVATIVPGLDLPSDPVHGLVALPSPSSTWSSCPSPQQSTARSGSAAKLTPSPSAGQQEWLSHRWPVLPPISPVRGEK